MPEKAYWRLHYHYSSNISGGEGREHKVIFTFGEDSQVGFNNFNWTEEVSSVKLIKLPQKNLKSFTESGQKFNLKKFPQTSLVSRAGEGQVPYKDLTSLDMRL